MSMQRFATITSAVVLLSTTAFYTFETLAREPRGGGDETPLPLPEPIVAAALDLSARADLFKAVHPGGRASTWNGFSTLYGRAFGGGPSAADAAERFRTDTLAQLFIDPAEIVPGMEHLPAGQNSVGLVWRPATQDYKFTAFYYTQHRDGVPVFGSGIAVLVRNEPGHPVVLAESGLRDLGDYRVAAGDRAMVNPARAHRAAQKALQAIAPVNFTAGRTVIWAGVREELAFPKLAIDFASTNSVGPGGIPNDKRFVVDAVTNAVLYEETVVHDFDDIAGNVSGRATGGTGADICFPVTAIQPLPYARVTAGATTVYADVNGNYVLPNGGTDPVSVTADLTGRYFNMKTCGGTVVPSPQGAPCTGATASQTAMVTPPGPGDFLFNDPDVAGSPGQFPRAEVNVYLQVNLERDLLLTHHPTFPSIANELNFSTNVNLGTTCNAFYHSTQQSINFYIAGGACSNTGNSTVIHHEYGHRIVNAAGSGQSSFGEGYGDCMSVLMLDDPCLGKGFSTTSSTPPCSPAVADCNGCLRRADNNGQYQPTGCSSCGGAGHACGQLLSGCVWSLRNNLLATNPLTYRQILGDLLINTVLLHTPTSNTSITPAITVHYLTIDDDDADISNGTPHYNEINGAFTAHNMPGPPLELVDFTFPHGFPTYASPAGTTTVRVDVTANAAAPQTGSGVLFADTGSGYQQYAMQELSTNQYLATIPASPCETAVKYYFRAAVEGGQTQTSPGTAPAAFFGATSAYGATLAMDDNFQTDQGWTVTNAPIAGGTFAGAWQRGVPVTPPSTGAPAADADGSGQCYVTTNSTTNPDVDFGFTTLTSPPVNTMGGSFNLKYSRWFHRTSTTVNGDVFRVQVTGDGVNWTDLEVFGSASGLITGSWVPRSFPVTIQSPTFQVRFTVNDNATNSTSVEGGVDGVKIEQLICVEPCPADATGNTVVDIDDLVLVITNWGAVGANPADVNGDLIVNIDDLVAVVTAWGPCL